MSRTRLLAALGALALAGCQTTEIPSDSVLAGPPPEPAEPAPPWTQDFQDEALLIAREIKIEGPTGLLDHVAMMQDPVDWVFDVHTTPEGLVQDARVRPESAVVDAVGRPPLRVHLDNLTIAVSHRVQIVERPTHAVDVVVRARGDVLWQGVGGAERRGPDLTLVGRRPER